MPGEQFDEYASEICCVYTDAAKRIACEIGDLYGLSRALGVKSANGSNYLSNDENLAYRLIIDFALKKMTDDKHPEYRRSLRHVT